MDQTPDDTAAQLRQELRAMTRLQELSAALVQHDDLKPLLQKILAAAADLTALTRAIFRFTTARNER